MKTLKHILFLAALLLLPQSLLAQAKKPTLMVIPADAWCNEHGYTRADDPTQADYTLALQNDTELLNVISKIGELMAERGFPLKDLGQALRSGDSQLQRVQADILMEVSWHINKIGPKQSVTYTLRGLDAYTAKQVAAAGGTGKPSIAAEVPVLLQEAVLEQMDGFQAQLQQHFDDLLSYGREVTIGVSIDPKSQQKLNFDSELDGEMLTDIIEEWVSEHTVSQRYNLSDVQDHSLLFEQVRIPLYDDNDMAMDTRMFVNQLHRYLNQRGLKSKVVTKGLGRADLVISKP